MGQFKPMVKMYTTEPTVELKLKKGGKVEKKMQMGGLPAAAMPSAPARGGMMPAMSPNRPSMAARRRAMMARPAGAAPAAPVGMAGRMMKEGGESKSEHKAEMTKMAKTAEALKKHADKPASKAHKGLKTGGVVMGQGGYKAGGIINTEGQGGKYRDTMMHTAKTDHSPAKTGEVKMGNAGGYATGGVAKSNAGGYKKGGAAKKGYAAGGVVDSGAPVAMPQGRKKPSAPVSINQLSGTFKKGGSVTAAEGRLQKNFKAENATAMKQAKAYSNEVYSKYGKKMNEGGSAVKQGSMTEAERKAARDASSSQGSQTEANRREMMRGLTDLSKGAYDKSIGPSEEEMDMARAIRSIPGRIMESARGLFRSEPSKQEGSVTKTKESVTVTPAKKRGGTVKC